MPELLDSREVFAGVKMTLRSPGQWPEYMWVHASAGPGGTSKGSPAGLQPRMDDKCIREQSGYSNL